MDLTITIISVSLFSVEDISTKPTYRYQTFLHQPYLY